MEPRVQANLGGRHRRALPAPLKPDQPTIEYLFEAQVTVPLHQWAEFDEKNGGTAGATLVKIHADQNLIIQHSGVEILGTPAGEKSEGLAGISTGADAIKSIRFYNYWSMGTDANNLPQAELRMSDNVVWATFDQRVQRHEVKHLLTKAAEVSLQPVAWQKQPGGMNVLRRFSGDKVRYMRLTYDVKRTELAEFVARLEGDVEAFGLEHGWILGDAFVYITGVEGRVVQLWLLPEEPDAKVVQKAIDEMPWRKYENGHFLIERPSQHAPDFYPPSPFDPVVASIARLISGEKEKSPGVEKSTQASP